MVGIPVVQPARDRSQEDACRTYAKQMQDEDVNLGGEKRLLKHPYVKIRTTGSGSSCVIDSIKVKGRSLTDDPRALSTIVDFAKSSTKLRRASWRAPMLDGIAT